MVGLRWSANHVQPSGHILPECVVELLTDSKLQTNMARVQCAFI